MSGWKFWESKKTQDKKKNQDAAQPAAAGVASLASQIGNQGMLDLAAANRPADGVKMPGMDELEQKMLAKLPVPGNTAPAGNASAEETAREMAEMQKTPEMARTSLSDLYTQLKTSKRGGLFTGSNSKYYDAVMDGLHGINTAMNQSFSQDAKENQKKLIEMEHRYQELISACAAYTARDPSTKAGQHRKELVTMIQARASSDLVALSAVRTDFCSLPPQEQSGKSWNELLDQSRTIRLSVKDFSELGKTEGGAASEVYKLNGSNATAKSAAGESISLSKMHFFKPEDGYDMTQEALGSKAVENVLGRFPQLSKKDKNLIRTWAAEAEDYYSIPQKPDGLSEQGKIALDAISNNLRGVVANVNTLIPTLELDQDEKVNMTRRNVATSRVAALLGLEGLVAKSETAELYDEATGHTIRGNLMEGAKGDMAAGEFDMKEGAKARAKRKRGEANSTKEVTAGSTGKFQRDLCNLQVLDVICGQIDRHENNYFVTLNEAGELDGLQAIDNDAAFGLNEDVATAKDATRHDRAIFDSEGMLTLPYMDKNLAERIKQLDPDMLRFALKDLLKDAEIEAAVKRLARTKAAIEKTQENKPECFLEDSEWNDDTAQELINEAWKNANEFYSQWMTSAKDAQKNAGKTLANENYFGRFMLRNTGVASISEYDGGEAPQIQRRKKKP